MTRSVSRRVGGLVVAVAAATTLVPAAAATGQPQPADTATVRAAESITDPAPQASVEASAAPEGTSARARVIRCTLTSDDPHRSHTAGSTNQINFHPKVQCRETGTPRAVPYIGLAGQMLRGDGAHGVQKSFSARNRWTLKGNAQKRCSDANRRYQGIAGATVHMPAGYTPIVVRMQIRSSVQTLNCRS